MSKHKSIIPAQTKELVTEVANTTVRAYIDLSGVQTNYYQIMEKLLYNYRKLESLVADKTEYTTVELHEKSKSLVFYSSTTGGGFKDYEDALEELEQARAMSYHRTRMDFEEVKRVVRLFESEKEFVVVRMYYFGEDANGNVRPKESKPYTWEDIAFELSEKRLLREVKTARRWRSKIVNDMAVCLFGISAAVSAGTYRAQTT